MLGKKKKNKSTEEETDKQKQLDLIKEILANTQANVQKALELLKDGNINDQALLESLETAREATKGLLNNSAPAEADQIIEGVFNGEKMVGPDGHEHSVPPNYASKSKLVEGDILKLTITKNGSFIYKQIGPIDRQQMRSMLVKNESTGEWYAMADGKRWKLLTAAVTYFHGQPGDEVVILIPKNSRSGWAAVENIIKINK